MIEPAVLYFNALNIAIPSVSNEAATVVYTGSELQQHTLAAVIWSYSAQPTNGGLVITEDGITVFCIDIIRAGHDIIRFPRPLKTLNLNTEVSVSLLPGGVNVFGKLNCIEKWNSH